jgi:hypothetical protein
MFSGKDALHILVDLAPLVGSVERRLNACSIFLNYGGGLTFFNSLLSSLPTFFICMLELRLGKLITLTLPHMRLVGWDLFGCEMCVN